MASPYVLLHQVLGVAYSQFVRCSRKWFPGLDRNRQTQQSGNE
jgi:hypothetical protein